MKILKCKKNRNKYSFVNYIKHRIINIILYVYKKVKSKKKVSYLY